MNFLKKNGYGLALCLVIALPCWYLGKLLPVIGGPVFAILAGMVITLLIKDKSGLQGGITFTSKKILQYAVILLGFGMNLSEIAKVGLQSLPIILSTITTSLVIALIMAVKDALQYFNAGWCRLFYLRRFCHCGNSTGHRSR